jgi:hypothetical protein
MQTAEVPEKSLAEFSESDKIHSSGTLLSRQWHFVAPISIVSYISLQLILSTQKNICLVDDPYAPWTYDVAKGVLGCYCIAVFYFLGNAIFINSWADREIGHLRGIYALGATINIIAGSATAIYVSDFGKYCCRDSLNMDSPNPQWAEWLVAAPLLQYVVVGVEDKEALTYRDMWSMFCMALCIFFGVIMNLSSTMGDFVYGVVMWVLSTVFMVISMHLSISPPGHHRQNANVVSPDDIHDNEWKSGRRDMKRRLAWLVVAVFNVFPLIYILGNDAHPFIYVVLY